MKRCSNSGFSLVELMIAILFVSIGFFGYVALHARLLHSGQRLEERERIRSITDLVEGIETTRATRGYDTSIDGTDFASSMSVEVPTLVWVSTKRAGKNNRWTSSLPSEHTEYVEQSLDLRCAVYPKPWVHRWRSR